MQCPPRPGPGLEGHEAERLRRRGADDLPDVDVHPVAELRELVDERDVDRAEDVLEQLRQLGRLGRRDGVHGVDRAAVDVGRGLGARGREPADDLRRRLRRPVGAARVDALGRHREVEVLAGLEAAALLEQRLDDLARRAGVRGRLEHDDLPAPQHGREPARGLLDVGEVGLALLRRAASAARSARRPPARPAP